MTHDEIIEIVQAHKGGIPVERAERGRIEPIWEDYVKAPMHLDLDFFFYDWRIKQ